LSKYKGIEAGEGRRSKEKKLDSNPIQTCHMLVSNDEKRCFSWNGHRN
jgi:hypothetical protein